VTLGGIEALIEEASKQLIERGRQGSPFQQARMGMAFIAQETIRLWTRQAALIAEGNESAPEEIAAYVNLARTAVEAAALDTLQLVQRSIGLAGFLQPSAIERIMRDLGTYLRQPAPDEALTEAGASVLNHGLRIGQE
jgi:alkylation response protein AidB-like acyl-CoA dehydrogenase